MTLKFPAYQALMEAGPFPKNKKKRDQLFTDALSESFKHHYEYCSAFSNYCDNRSFSQDLLNCSLTDLPFIPVQAFKAFGKDLLVTSVPDEKLFFMNSSATSGQPSYISVSRGNAKRQALSMAHVVTSFLGSQKRPFIIFDVNRRRKVWNNRGSIWCNSWFHEFFK